MVEAAPHQEPGTADGHPTGTGYSSTGPLVGTVLVLAVALGIGMFLPLMGISLAAFVLVDLVLMGLKNRKHDRRDSPETISRRP